MPCYGWFPWGSAPSPGVDAHPVPEKSGAAGSLETSSDHPRETWPVRGEQGFTCLRVLTEKGTPGWSLDVAGRCDQKHPLKMLGTLDDYGITIHICCVLTMFHISIVAWHWGTVLDYNDCIILYM